MSDFQISPLSTYDGTDYEADIASLPLNMQAQYRALAANKKAYDDALEKNVYAPQREMWSTLEKDLRARRSGPSTGEFLSSLGAALLSPSTSRGFGGMMADIAPVFAAQQKAKREDEEAKRDLLMKYSMKGKELELEQKKAQIEAARALGEARFKLGAKTPKDIAPPRVVVDANGNALHPSLGYRLPQIGEKEGQVPPKAIQFLLSTDDPAADRAFDLKYNAPGYSKLIRDYYNSRSSIPASTSAFAATDED